MENYLNTVQVDLTWSAHRKIKGFKAVLCTKAIKSKNIYIFAKMADLASSLFIYL